jgi:NADH-quinone oxidoreductase subunit A
MTLSDYLPIALMFLLGSGFAAAAMWLSWRIAPKNPTPEKLAPYECGIVPLQEPVERFPVKFYLVAMLFVIFDVEIVFLFAWAVSFDQLGWAGIAAVGVFVLLLAETLV